MENPLVWPVLKLLRDETYYQEKMGWKVNEILAALSKLDLLPKLDVSSDKDLFKKNFLIMNALYQLQTLLQEEKYLQIDSMDIRFVDLQSVKKNNREQNANIARHDPLREYYSNWDNYETSVQEIQQLFDDFWSRYAQYNKRSENPMSRSQALSLFNLEPDATRIDIKRRWRRLALQWHPDRKEGNEKKFRLYCEAWALLRKE